MKQDKLIEITKCIGSARSFLQHNIKNGDRVTWGSHETLTLTVRQIEEMAIEITEKAIKHYDTYLKENPFICIHCGSRKRLESGLCDNCCKFPPIKKEIV